MSRNKLILNILMAFVLVLCITLPERIQLVSSHPKTDAEYILEYKADREGKPKISEAEQQPSQKSSLMAAIEPRDENKNVDLSGLDVNQLIPYNNETESCKKLIEY